MFSYQFLVYYYYFLYFGFVIDVSVLFLHLCVYNFVLGCSFWFFWFHHVLL